MVRSELHTDKQLLELISKDDQQAFAAFISRHWKNIFGHALVWLKSPEQAEEMAQDVFVKLWKSRQQISDVRNIESYLFIIARNTMISKIRDKLRDPDFINQQENEEQSSRPDRMLENKETFTILMDGIGLLPAKRQQVFKMSRFEGLRNAEIAERLGMNKDTVKQYLAKAVAFLKAYLKERIATFWIVVLLIS